MKTLMRLLGLMISCVFLFLPQIVSAETLWEPCTMGPSSSSMHL
jgi:hypothetical protein